MKSKLTDFQVVALGKLLNEQYDCLIQALDEMAVYNTLIGENIRDVAKTKVNKNVVLSSSMEIVHGILSRYPIGKSNLKNRQQVKYLEMMQSVFDCSNRAYNLIFLSGSIGNDQNRIKIKSVGYDLTKRLGNTLDLLIDLKQKNGIK
jgi:hypothetical protein